MTLWRKHVQSGLPDQGVITEALFIDPALKHLSGTRTCGHAQPGELFNEKLLITTNQICGVRSDPN